MTTPNPYAELLRAIADGKELQFEEWDGKWSPQDTADALHEFAAKDYMPNRYRVKPATITVNGIEVPEPMRERPPSGTRYFAASLARDDLASPLVWDDDDQDRIMLSRGVAHLTKDAAIAHAEAMIAPSKREAA